MFGVEGETKESFLKKSGKGNTFQFFFFLPKRFVKMAFVPME